MMHVQRINEMGWLWYFFRFKLYIFIFIFQRFYKLTSFYLNKLYNKSIYYDFFFNLLETKIETFYE